MAAAAALSGTGTAPSVPISTAPTNSTSPKPYPHCHPHQCFSQEFVDRYVRRFSHILEHNATDLGSFEQTMETMLAADFKEISGSINILAGHPLDGVSAPSKEAYISGISYAPPIGGVNTIFAYVAGCRNIIWHWEFTAVGTGQYPVKGFNFFEINEYCRICTLQVEFSSIAWGLDTGYKLVLPNGTVQSK